MNNDSSIIENELNEENIQQGIDALEKKSNEELNFDSKVNELSNIVKEKKEDEFKGFDTRKGLFTKKITGAEMNEYHETVVQSGFEKVNERENQIIKEVSGIYGVINTLQKEYLPWISKTLRLGKKANKEALIAQKNNEKNLEIQKGVINKFKDFKEKIEDLHLEERISQLSNKLETLEDEHNENIRALVDFRTKLEAQKHLYQIDETWKDAQNNKEQLLKVDENVHLLNDDVKSQKGSISEFGRRIHSAEGKINAHEAAISDVNRRIRSINDTIALHKNSLKELQSEKEKLQQLKHITDIDYMWSQIQNFENKMAVADTENQKRDDKINVLNTKAEAQEIKSNELLSMILEEQEKTKKLVNKLKIAYAVAGASATIAIVNLILSVIGMV